MKYKVLKLVRGQYAFNSALHNNDDNLFWLFRGYFRLGIYVLLYVFRLKGTIKIHFYVLLYYLPTKRND